MFGKKIALAALLTITTSVAAFAQAPALIKEFKDWGAYSYQSPQGKLCFVLTPHKTAAPLSENGKTLDHGQNYILVAQRTGQNTTYEPQVMMSYTMKEGSKVTMKIGDASYSFYTRGKVAHLEKVDQEAAVVAALRAGSSASIQAISSRTSAPRNYSFSLSGISAALQNIVNCK